MEIMIMIMIITIIFITILNSFLITLIPWMLNSIEVALDDYLNLDLNLDDNNIRSQFSQVTIFFNILSLLYCTVLYSTVLYSTLLYCTIFSSVPDFYIFYSFSIYFLLFYFFYFLCHIFSSPSKRTDRGRMDRRRKKAKKINKEINSSGKWRI